MQHEIHFIPLDFTMGTYSKDLLQALDIIQTQDWVLLIRQLPSCHMPEQYIPQKTRLMSQRQVSQIQTINVEALEVIGSGIQDNSNLEWTQTNMTPRQQIKSLSITSDPITAGLRQEMDTLLDNNLIADTQTHCHVFLDHIQSKRKLVQGTMDRSKV